MPDPLVLREEPTEERRDLLTRTFAVRIDTANEEERSIEAVISTEGEVDVYDWRRGEVVREVLLARGAELPPQLPLLADHDRWSIDSVLGKATGIRVEAAEGQVERLTSKLEFVRGDADADRAWNKVRQGALRDLSVGYRVIEAVEIRAGEKATVAGRQFSAGQRALRVATRWIPKEVSLVPIGADPAAKTRSTPIITKGDINMEENLPATETRIDPPAVPATPEPARNEPSTPPTPDDAARAAVAAERERVRAVRQLAGTDVPAETLTRAIDEGWDAARASQEFLAAVRANRNTYHPSAYTGPSPSGNGNDTVRALAAGLLMTHGCDDPTTRSMHDGRRDPGPAERLTAQDAERGARFRGMSMADMIRHAAFADTGRAYLGTGEALDAIRANPSGGTLAYIFTTSMYAKLVEGWEKIADTTAWCESEDVPNFLTQEDLSLAANARLDRHPRGGTAKHATFSDSRETYKISRYSKQFVVDEMDQIDDRLGAILRMPAEMGEAAAETIPDLVYSLLLENGTMADTGALFNATAVTTAGGHANLTTAVLGATGLKAAILAMGKYRDGDRVLNIRPKFLIIPSALLWTAKELLTSTAQAYTAAAAAATPSLYYPINVIAGENLTLVVDDRIGAVGCWDPEAATTRTGLDTNWFLSASRRTVRKLFRSGTGRRPQMRSFVLDRGQWGMGWDINFDAGAMVPDYRGLHKSAGTG